MTATEDPPAGGPAIKVELANEPIHWDVDPAHSYGAYLDLERLLAAQHPRSPEHDEMLFIIVHQASELWMKLALHELRSAIDGVRRDDLALCFKRLTRIGHVQQQLVRVWDVLATLTPFDYSSFRNQLGRSSGFQSAQYRLLEFMIGNKNAELLAVHHGDPTAYAELQRGLAAPSLYDECLRLLSQRGFEIPEDRLARDFSMPYVAHKQVIAAWLAVYHSADTHPDLCELAEKLMDLDHRFQLWRFAHLKTVERIIGYKRGTGGSSGVAYLAKVLELRFFPELWLARTSM